MINNKPTFYADYADQVQVPDSEGQTPLYTVLYQDMGSPTMPLLMPECMARISKFVLKVISKQKLKNVAKRPALASLAIFI